MEIVFKLAGVWSGGVVRVHIFAQTRRYPLLLCEERELSCRAGRGVITAGVDRSVKRTHPKV